MSRTDSKGYRLNTGESQRKDGRYTYAYTDRMGKRHYIYRKSLVELREAEKKIARDYDDGLDPIKAKHISVNQMVENYISTKYNLKVTSKGTYMQVYNLYIKDDFGKYKIFDVKYSDVKKYYYSLIIERGLKASTVDHVHAILRPAFQMAVRDGLIRINPTDEVMAEIKRSKFWVKPDRKALTVEEQRIFMDIFRNDPTFKGWLPLMTVLLGTGMRIGEALALSWDKVDFENRVIHVERTMSNRPDEFGKCIKRILTTKTNAGTRTIPMVQEVFDAFIMEYEFQKVLGFCEEEIDGYKDFIFVSGNNTALLPNAVNRAIHSAVNKYNSCESAKALIENRKPFLLPEQIYCHILRHTFCTRLCENESNIKVIQSIMGHSDITTTMNIYADVTKEKKQEIMTNLEGKIII